MMTNRKLITLVNVVLTTGLGSVAALAQSVIYVDDDAAPGGDGRSWSAPHKYLQDAVARAGGTDEVRIAGGTYRPDKDEAGAVTPGDRTERFNLTESILLRGGYAGLSNPDAPDTRDVVLYETTLTGDLSGNDGPDFTGYEENSSHVVYATTGVTGARLDGITISGGSADGVTSSLGGGMAIFGNAHVQLSNVRIEQNQAALGGGLYVNGTGAVVEMQSCSIRRNRAFSPTGDGTNAVGGGMRIRGDVHLTVTGGTIEYNEALTGGGLAIADATALVEINGCRIAFNDAIYDAVNGAGGSGGGVRASSGAAVELHGCTVEQNTGTRGGGIYGFSGFITVVGCEIVGNVVTTGAVGSGWGAGIGTWATDVLVIRSRIYGNAASRTGGGMAILATQILRGTGADAGSAKNTDADASDREDHDVQALGQDRPVRSVPVRAPANAVLQLNTALLTPSGGARAKRPPANAQQTYERLLVTGRTVLNSAVFGNTAERGGGIAFQAQSASILNCTITQNTVTSHAGGLRAYSSSDVTVANSILWGNTAPTSPEIDLRTGSVVSVSYSDVKGGQAATFNDGTATLNWNAGNIDADPSFSDVVGADGQVGTKDDDLTLAAGSSCIDAADNASIAVCSIDLAKDKRRVDDAGTADTGSGTSPIVDMGGYEFGSLLAVDCNGNHLDDVCEIAESLLPDCNGNGEPDECELASGEAERFASGGLFPIVIVPSQGSYPPGFFVPDLHLQGVLHVSPDGSSVSMFTSEILIPIDSAFAPNEFGGVGDRLFVTSFNGWDSPYDAAIVHIDVNGTRTPFVTIPTQRYYWFGVTYLPLSIGGPNAGKLLVTAQIGDDTAPGIGAIYTVDSAGTPTLVVSPVGYPILAPTLAPAGFGSFGSQVFAGNVVGGELVAWDPQTNQISLFGNVPLDAGQTGLRMVAFSPVGWFAGFDPALSGKSLMVVSVGVSVYGYGVNGKLVVFDEGGALVATLDRTGFGQEIEPLGLHFQGDQLLVVNAAPGHEGIVSVTVADFAQGDCNRNGVPDLCDIAGPTSSDCNANAIPDECEIDCQPNGVPDDCDLALGSSLDCNTNNLPDECEPFVDCNNNGTRDICDIGAGTSLDCNSNNIPDACDIDAGTSADCNGDAVPDECPPCTADCECDDGDVCTVDHCVGGLCTFTGSRFGDVNDNGTVNVFDLFCVLTGFGGDFSACAFEDDDIEPCEGNGAIDIFDLFSVLNAFGGADPCCEGAGACCTLSGCQGSMNHANCVAGGGTYMGDGTTCAQLQCPYGE